MRERCGFTLIELLIVVVILGLLAAIAIPKFSTAREKAYISAMKHELRSLASQQELYYSKYLAYTSSILALEYNISGEVGLGIIAADANGWAVSATHKGFAATRGCAYFVGEITPPSTPGGLAVATTQQGLPVCDP
ncbi:MAG: prepilin-type N-terminal cleavage/methylation domain-containing protein [Gemmatimonadetes bacterium]|nr:prepilin-type N-terminal cleavage/methylation domain-containing protein [Gemmatimonadota bacterium]